MSYPLSLLCGSGTTIPLLCSQPPATAGLFQYVALSIMFIMAIILYNIVLAGSPLGVYLECLNHLYY